MNYEPSTLAKLVENSYNKAENIGQFIFVKSSLDDKVRYYHDKENDTFVITHRGTNPADIDDLKSDLNLGLGSRYTDKQYKQRTEETKKMIKEIKRKQPNTKIILAAHSLGADTALFSANNDEFIRNNIHELTYFNRGKSPIPLLDQDVHPELKDRTFEYKIQGDAISQGKLAPKASVQKQSLSRQLVGTTTLGSVFNTLTNHSISRFYKK